MAVPSDAIALFVQHRKALVDYAASIVGSRAHAEDLVQDAWMRFDDAARQRFVNEPLSYLYRIVRNLAFDGRRRKTLEGTFFTKDDPEDAATVSIDQPSTPEAIALHRERLARMIAALAELSEEHRIAFEMHRVGGFPLREVAAKLRISISHAQVLVMEALQHCKQRLR